MLGQGRPPLAGEPRSTAWAIGLLAAVLFMHHSWGVRFVTVREAYQLLTTPVRQPMLWIRGVGREAAQTVADVHALQQENGRLRLQLRDLTRKLEEREEIALENERLKGILGFKGRERQFDWAVAEVVGRDPHPLRRTLLVDKGTADGVGRDDPVVLPEGVLGRVVDAYRTSSRVLLLQDVQSSIGALLQRSRVTGDAQGTGGETLVVRNVPQDTAAAPDDLLVTSGMSTFYPKGLPIGKVVQVTQDPKTLAKEIQVRPVADASRCEEVLILRRPKAPPAPVTGP